MDRQDGIVRLEGFRKKGRAKELKQCFLEQLENEAAASRNALQRVLEGRNG